METFKKLTYHLIWGVNLRYCCNYWPYVDVLISFHRKGFCWLNNHKCNARDQASDVMLRKWFCVKNLRRHAIDNHSRDLQASNWARLSIKPGRTTRSKRQLFDLSKNQRWKREAELSSSSLTLGAALPQHKGGQSLSGLPRYKRTFTTPRGVL